MIALLLAAVLAVAPGVVQQLDANGASMVMQLDPSETIGAISVSVPAGLDRQRPGQNGFAALTAECILRTRVGTASTIASRVSNTVVDSSATLSQAVSALGASVSTSVDADAVRFVVEGRGPTLTAAAFLLANVVATPSFEGTTLAAAKTSVLARGRENDGDPIAVVASMVRGIYYQRTGVAYPRDGSASVISTATPADLRAYFAEHYRRTGLRLSLVGAVDAGATAAALGLSASLPEGPTAAPTFKLTAPTDPPIRVVTHRAIASPTIGLGFAAPSAGNRDFPAMLVIAALLDSVGRPDSIVTPSNDLRTSGILYQYDLSKANIVVYATGSGLGTAGGLRDIFTAIDLLANRSLDPAILSRFRETARGQLVVDHVTAAQRAQLLGVFDAQGLAPKFYSELPAAIDAVTREDVRRVARTYLKRYSVGVVLPRTTGR